MKLLIFLVLTPYRLACKYRIISQISIYDWKQNGIFRYLWYCIFIFLRSKCNFLRQVRWFVTWWFESIIISWDSNLTQNIRETIIKVGEKRDERDLVIVQLAVRIWLKILGNSYSSTTKKWINKKKHLTINNIKLNFLKKPSSTLHPFKRHLKCQEL